MWNAGRSVYLAGLGVVAVAEEETRGVFDRLVTRGERFEKDDKRVVQFATGKAREVGRKVEDTVQNTFAATLKRAGVPSRKEISTLTRRVEQLTRKVDQLSATR
jgi:polyhydroxyalkanoate synthesis regulator phasin